MIRKMVSHETAEYSSVVFDAIQSIEIEEKEQSSIEWPPPLSRSIWLVFSSCFFLVPGLYAFINSCFFIGLVSSLTTFNVCGPLGESRIRTTPKNRQMHCVGFVCNLFYGRNTFFKRVVIICGRVTGCYSHVILFLYVA